jgi:transposase
MKLPDGDHYAIITIKITFHDGDERSRTNPGHGYPAYSEETLEYRVFYNKNEWEREIERLTQLSTRFRAIVAKAVKITTTIEISQ